jgi:hypothetical protein
MFMYLKRYQACIPSPLLTVRFRPPSNRSFPFKSFTSMHLHTLSARRNTSTILFSTSSALFLPSRRVWGCSPPSTQAYLSLDFSCPLSTLNCSPNAKGRWSMSTSPPTPLQSTVTKNPGGWVSGPSAQTTGFPRFPRRNFCVLSVSVHSNPVGTVSFIIPCRLLAQSVVREGSTSSISTSPPHYFSPPSPAN